METKFEQGRLTVILPEKINTENHTAIETELFALEHLEAAEELVLDAENLHYISSLGLRVILHFKKSHGGIPVNIINTSEDIYNIFETTGFTSFFNIRKKLRFVDTAGFELIGSGMYGSVYRINDEQVLKVFYGMQSEEDIEPVINTIRCAFVHELPTTIPFEIVRTEKGIGTVLELLNSETLSKVIEKDPQNLAMYVDKMLALSKTLARTAFKEGELRSRKEMLKAKLKGAAPFLSAEELGTIETYIDAVPDRATAVHGDFHAKNLMISKGKLMLIDMDEFSTGHPLWDVANLYCIYQGMVHLDKKIAYGMFDLAVGSPYDDFYFKIVGCTLPQAEVIWDKFFNGYFADSSREDKEKILKLVAFYGNIKFITFLVDICAILKDQPEKLAEKVKYIRYFLTESEKENLHVLLKYLDLWK